MGLTIGCPTPAHDWPLLTPGCHGEAPGERGKTWGAEGKDQTLGRPGLPPSVERDVARPSEDWWNI